MARSPEGRRTPMLLLALFGGVALVLSAIGIYGVLAFGVTLRAREFGIRQALGADRRAVLRLVLTQGLRTAGLGVAIGLAGAFVLTRFMSSLLFNIAPTDATTFAAIPALLLVVALLASYIPARRAAEVDPVVSLRYE